MSMHQLNLIDYLIIIFILLSVIISFARGFIREALSLVTWVVAAWVAFHFSSDIALMMEGHISSPAARLGLSAVALFLVTLFLGALINYGIGQMIDKTGLTGTDRSLGVIFGFGRGVLIIALGLVLATLTPLPQSKLWQKSVVIPHFQPMTHWLQTNIPDYIDDHMSIADAQKATSKAKHRAKKAADDFDS